MTPGPHEMLTFQSSLHTCCLQAAECLGCSLELPPQELRGKVDEAQNLVVQLRNGLIQCLRGEQAREGFCPPSRFRGPLDQVNVALSLIEGVVSPGSKVHRRYIEEAHQILQEVRTGLPAGDSL